MKITPTQKPKKSTKSIVGKRYTDEKTGKFKKGNPGGGRPKGSFSITALVKAELQRCPEGEDKETYADLVVKRIMSKAIKDGDTRMIERIWAYMDGLPKQNLDVMSGGQPIPLFDYAKDTTGGDNHRNEQDTKAKKTD